MRPNDVEQGLQAESSRTPLQTSLCLLIALLLCYGEIVMMVKGTTKNKSNLFTYYSINSTQYENLVQHSSKSDNAYPSITQKEFELHHISFCIH